MWGWGCGGNKSERHEGINWTKKFMQKGNACGMVKHFCILTAFVEVQIKRQEKSARDDQMQSCFQLSRRSP